MPWNVLQACRARGSSVSGATLIASGRAPIMPTELIWRGVRRTEVCMTRNDLGAGSLRAVALANWECRVTLSRAFCRCVQLSRHLLWRRRACFRRCRRRRRPRHGRCDLPAYKKVLRRLSRPKTREALRAKREDAEAQKLLAQRMSATRSKPERSRICGSKSKALLAQGAGLSCS